MQQSRGPIRLLQFVSKVLAELQDPFAVVLLFVAMTVLDPLPSVTLLCRVRREIQTEGIRHLPCEVVLSRQCIHGVVTVIKKCEVGAISENHK